MRLLNDGAAIGDIAARLAAPAQNSIALLAPSFVRRQMAPQAIEKAQNEPGIGTPFGPPAGHEPLTQAKAFPFIDSLDKSPAKGVASY